MIDSLKLDKDRELTFQLNTKKYVRRGTLLTGGYAGKLILYKWSKHKGRQVFVSVNNEINRKITVRQVS